MSNVDKILEPFENYVAKEHDKTNPIDYDRLQELINLIDSAAQAKKELSEEIDNACKKMGAEIKLIRRLQDNILKNSGILKRSKRRKQNDRNDTKNK